MKKIQQNDKKIVHKKHLMHQPMSLASMLICLTILFVLAQFTFAFAHTEALALIDTLVKSSILSALLKPVIFLPMLYFIFWHLLAYALWIVWIWFLAMSFSELFHCSARQKYCLGIIFGLIA